jgi:hypothetical protein
MPKKILFLLVVFLEGGALLSYEIMAAKLYTPHVGATLYVWTSILTLTLVSLAIAYKVSQYWSDRKKWHVLPLSLLIAGLYVIFILLTKDSILPMTYTMGIKTASFVFIMEVVCQKGAQLGIKKSINYWSVWRHSKAIMWLAGKRLKQKLSIGVLISNITLT